MSIEANRRAAAPIVAGAAIVVAAVTFIIVPAWQLIGPGPFDWHVRQPAFWQGGIEALALAALLAAGLAINRGGALIGLVALPAALYLRRHAVDAGVGLDLLQLEITVGVGMALGRALRVPPARTALGYVQAFVAGFALWSVCAWSLQALGIGSLRAMGWLAVALAMLACGGGHRPLLVFLWQAVRERELADRIWCGVLAAWLLVLFARAATAIGFDAQWYGLRSPFVLVPGGSVYESLGLVSPVHYFPKIYEVFSLSLYVLKDHVAINGFSIVLLLPLLLICGELMRRWNTPQRARLPLLALIATLPALADNASAKPDMLATLLVLTAAVFGFDALRRRSPAALAWQWACIALACSAKITAIPYAGMVLLATLAAWPRASSAATQANETEQSARQAWVVLALSAVAAMFVAARTLLLAGVPTIGPDPLVNLWRALGMDLAAPAGTLSWTNRQDWSDVPTLLVDLLFRPQRLEHIVISWVGNVWLWLWAIAGAAAIATSHRAVMPARSHVPVWVLIATGLALAIGNRYQVRGGDGNYFVFSLLPAIVCAGTAAFRHLAARPRVLAATLACLPLFVAFQAAYCFASVAWTPGTRAFDLDLSQSPRSMRRLRNSQLERAGMARIAAILRELPPTTRVVGVAETPAQFWLPARFEDLPMASYSRPRYIADARAVRQFLRADGVRYLVMPLEGVKQPRSIHVPPSVAEAAQQLAALPGARRIDDEHYYLLDLSAVDADTLAPERGWPD